MNSILNPSFMPPADQIVLIISRIYKGRMTTTSGGNISVMDKNGDIWITPSAVDKGSLLPSDIVCIKQNGEINGKHKPSSEFAFHKAVYEIRPDLKAIIHAHPPALVSFSIVHAIPNTNIIAHARQICGSIGYAAYDLPGSEQLGAKIASEFKKGFNAIIMENHGTVVGGSDMSDVFGRFETLEFCARTILYGKTIGTPQFLSDRQIEEFESHIPAMPQEMSIAEYSLDEKEKRSEVCRIVHRACDQGLMISSFGTVSIRLQRNDFLITPGNISRWDLQESDFVQIRNGKCEAGKIPSRAAWLHYEIYTNNPAINSIICTQSPYLMAFSVTNSELDVRTIPESWIFLQQIPSLSFGSPEKLQKDINQCFSEDIPALMVQNHSVWVTGDKLLQTFDRLEVAEFSAKSLVKAKPLGNLIPITDNQVEDLRRVFLKKN